MDFLCCTGGADDGSRTSKNRRYPDGKQETKLLECDYDSSCTKLYKMIEAKNWDEIIYFLETSKWYFDTSAFTSILFGSGPDPRFVEARTWVTALDEKGSVRWCQLPLHAAITFQAPFEVIKKLVSVYPESIRCADDQDMLPLHYAFRFGSEDKILAFILEEFPQATRKRALRDRLPLDMAHYSSKPERALVIEAYVDVAVADAKHRWRQQNESQSVRASMHSKLRVTEDERQAPQNETVDPVEENPQGLESESRDESSVSSVEDVAVNKKRNGIGKIFGRKKQTVQ